MSGAGYNGWANYETWSVPLWIDNDEASQGYWQEAALDIYSATEEADTRNPTLSRIDRATFALADRLKEEITESAPVTDGLYGQLLSGALSEVRWGEIARRWIEGAAEDFEQEQEQE